MKDILFLFLILWNVLVFIIYAIDKHKARSHQWRISEKTLISSALLAGGVGAFLAGMLCHHKTRKWYFRITWLLGLLIDFIIMLGLAHL